MAAYQRSSPRWDHVRMEAVWSNLGQRIPRNYKCSVASFCFAQLRARWFGLRRINGEPVTVEHHPQSNGMLEFLSRTSPSVPEPDLEPLGSLNKSVCVQ
jgi:hypothetical protein